MGTHIFAARLNILHILHISQHGREAARVKALRPLRGASDAALTQAFLLGNFSAMWGMGRYENQFSQSEAMTDVSLNTAIGDSVSPGRRGGNRMLIFDLSHSLASDARRVANFVRFIHSMPMLLLSDQLHCRLPRCGHTDRLSK